jgi:uncharacterized protein (DUF952 family)
MTEHANLHQIAYKIERATTWDNAMEAGVYTGSPLDVADGFIHLSSAETVADTLRLHFTGQEGLVLVAINLADLGDTVVWEASRGGALFPHIYGSLPMTACATPVPLPVVDGVHVLL